MDQFIYTNKNSISKELCEDIIELYNENLHLTYKGRIQKGYDPEVKDFLDFLIDKYIDSNPKWKKIHDILIKELYDNLKNYSININNNILKIVHPNSVVRIGTAQIQKYEKNKGKYIYHNDSQILYEQKEHRILTFLWYLNDVEEGGETEILGTIKIKPETGKILLFPADWTFPHCGKMPISNDKYIITGWVYTN